MTYGPGHFGYQSIVYAALVVMVVSMLTLFANAVINATAFV